MNPKIPTIVSPVSQGRKIEVRKDANALRSTGPRTPEGKAASSRNSLRHGLTARQTVIRGEDQADFDALLQNLSTDRKPEGELEIQLTSEIASSMWRLARVRQHEAELLEVSCDLYSGIHAQKLQLILRYAGSIERQLNRAIVRLEYLQNQRRKSPQFVSQSAENTANVATPLAAQPAAAEPEASPMVMVAGSARPRFVSQIADNPQPPSGPEPSRGAPGADSLIVVQQ